MSGAAAGGRWLHLTCQTRENRNLCKITLQGRFYGKHINKTIVRHMPSVYEGAGGRSSCNPRMPGTGPNGQGRLETARKIDAARLPRDSSCRHSTLAAAHDRKRRGRFSDLRAASSENRGR